MPEEEGKEAEGQRKVLNYKFYQHQKTVNLSVLKRCVIIFTMYGMNNMKVYVKCFAVFPSATLYCITVDNAYWVHRRKNCTVIATEQKYWQTLQLPHNRCFRLALRCWLKKRDIVRISIGESKTATNNIYETVSGAW